MTRAHEDAFQSLILASASHRLGQQDDHILPLTRIRSLDFALTTPGESNCASFTHTTAMLNRPGGLGDHSPPPLSLRQ